MKKEELKLCLQRNCLGRARAISGKELANVLQTSENEVRRIVNCLRRDGVPIASSRYGYFYSETAGEVYSTIRSLKKMRAGLQAAIAGLEEALEAFSGDGGAKEGS